MKEQREPKIGDGVIVLRCVDQPDAVGETGTITQIEAAGLSVRIGERQEIIVRRNDVILRK